MLSVQLQLGVHEAGADTIRTGAIRRQTAQPVRAILSFPSSIIVLGDVAVEPLVRGFERLHWSRSLRPAFSQLVDKFAGLVICSTPFSEMKSSILLLSKPEQGRPRSRGAASIQASPSTASRYHISLTCAGPPPPPCPIPCAACNILDNRSIVWVCGM